jgi:inosine-uridine nucleoside N-ribohydrolase
MRWSSIIVIFLLFPVAVKAETRNVWIDADPACGLSVSDDVDDCWAIIAALRSEQLNVVGISTVFGNTSIDNVTLTVQELLKATKNLEPALTLPPVYRGAADAKDVNSDAVSALATELENNSLTIMALGPLTNIAAVVERHPHLVSKIDSLIAVAGQKPGDVFKVGNTPFLHFHDLNVKKDPTAFEVILQTNISVHLMPFEAGIQISINQNNLNTLAHRSPLEAWLAERSRPWLSFWEEILGANGFAPFDTLAVAYLTSPEFFNCMFLSANLVRKRGMFVVRDKLEMSPTDKAGTKISYCYSVSDELRRSPLKLIQSKSESGE